MLPLALLVMLSPVRVSEDGTRLTADNGEIRLQLDKPTGRFSVSEGGRTILRDVFGEVRIGDSTVRTDAAGRHEVEFRKVSDRFGNGICATFRHWSVGKPELRQTFWVYAGHSETFIRIAAIGSKELASNYLAPIVTDRPLRFPHRAPLQSLFVPYDNDSYFRYRSDGWGGDGSHEVGAIYDEDSRHGLIVGSIDHDLWKSAVRFDRGGGIRAYAGASDKYTHDKDPHGSVLGHEIRSPRFVVGFYRDWRSGLERYGDLNAIVEPPLSWKGAVPFGWNSWSGHKNKVNARDADAALEFVRDELPRLRSGGTAYINLDSYWDNLTPEQRVAFVKKAHALGLKAGIYWTPFVNWGEPDWKANDGYFFKDIQLKDSKGELLPKLDGGWPLDPTHPGTLARIDKNIKEFVDQGFDYIKLDFMTHGALEGRHFDPRAMTGNAAYRIGMRRIVDDLSVKRAGRQIIISLSIAPMFPAGFAHSRRISCDVFGNIGASEYFLNSQNYGWWAAGRLYRFNDPDSACVYQTLGEAPTTPAEARTRFTASVIGGGMMIDGDDLTNSAARERVRTLFSNRELLSLAQQSPSFRPLRGDTGDKAGDVFVHLDRKGNAYVAAFNFNKSKVNSMKLPLARLGLSKGQWSMHDLWTGEQRTIGDTVEFHLPPMDCALVRLIKKQ